MSRYVTLSRRSASGFTLIEIIVVVLIIGLITLSITVNFTTRLGIGSQATNSAHRLQQLFLLLQELALFHNREYGANVMNDEVTFYHYRLTCDASANTTLTHCHPPYYWQRIENDNLLRQQSLPRPLRLKLTATALKGALTKTDNAAPAIVFYPNGAVTPFTLEIQDAQQTSYFRLQGQTEGELIVTDLGRIEK